MTRSDLDLNTLTDHLQGLARLAGALLRDADAGRDVAQEAALRALSAPEGPRAPAERRAWLGLIVRRIVIDQRRALAARREREREHGLARGPAAPSTEEIASRAEVAALLHGRLRALPDELARTMTDRYLGGLTPAAIARRDGISVNTVNARLRRGRSALREDLERRGIGRDGRWSSLASLAAMAPDAAPRAAALAGGAAGLAGWKLWSLVAVGVAVLVVGRAWVDHSPDTPGRPAADEIDGATRLARVDRESPGVAERAAVASGPSRAAAPVPADGPRSAFAGIVIDTAGRPIPGVRVWIEGVRWVNGERLELPTGSTTTDEGGRYRVDVPFAADSSQSLRFQPGEFHVTHRISLDRPIRAEVRTLGPVVLTRAGSAAGRVVDGRGRGVPGVEVDFGPGPRAGYGMLPSTQTTTEEDGSFVLGHVPKGTMDFWFRKDGLQTAQRRAVRVRLGARSELGTIEVVPSPVLKGRVVTEEGAGVPELHVVARDSGGFWDSSHGSTDAQGRFLLRPRSDLPQRLEIHGETIEPIGVIGDREQLVRADADSLLFVVEEVERTTFFLRDALTGEPIQAGSVRVVRNGGSRSEDRVWSTMGPGRPHPTDEGRILEPARPGVDLVRIAAPGYESFEGDVVHDGNEPRTQVIDLVRAPSFEGSVQHLGDAVPGILVEVLGQSGRGAGSTRAITTDDRGVYLAEGLLAGSYVARATSTELGAQGQVSFHVARRRDGAPAPTTLRQIPALVLDQAIAVASTGTIRGRVDLPVSVEPEGLYVYHGPWGDADFVALGPDARFTLTDVPAGPVTVSLADRPGLVSDGARVDVTLAADEDMEVLIDARRHGACSVELTVEILGADPEQVNVRIQHETGQSKRGAIPFLGSDGKIVLEERASGPARIELFLPGGQDVLLPEPSLDLQPGATIREFIRIEPGSVEVEVPQEFLDGGEESMTVSLESAGLAKPVHVFRLHREDSEGSTGPIVLEGGRAMLPFVVPGEYRVVGAWSTDGRHVHRTEATVMVRPGETSRLTLPPMEPVDDPSSVR